MDRLIGWGYKQGLKGIRKQIEKVAKKKRLVFLGDNKVLYIDKQGNKVEYSFDEMAVIAVKIGGWEEQMATLGITHQDVVNILVEEYAKHKKEAK